MIKLVVSDIDGTLLRDGENELNPELLEVILELRAKGIQVAAASGRQWASIETVFEPIKEKIFYLSDNGAYVGCHGRCLFTNPIERGLVMEIVKDIRGEGMIPIVSGINEVYMDTIDQEFYDWMVNGYKFRVQMVDDLSQVKEDFIKVSAYKKERVEEATVVIREKYKNRLKLTISGDMWLDGMALGVNKGQAVGLLQESLGITPEETIVFGDQMNDMEMMQQAYYSYAVGNARPEIKAAARFQTDTNVNHGVLKILRLL